MRKIWDIHGGIHPAENKQQSLQGEIEYAAIPPQLVFPLSQHIGAPATPCVKPGDHVLKGQCIANATGPVSVPIHASSSGTVSAIEDRAIPHASGIHDRCIVIETDGKDTWRNREPRPDWNALPPEELINIVRSSGITGMGGAGFPTAIKLNAPPEKNIHTLIINGTECEPYITADHALMRERSAALAEGIAVLAKIISPGKIIVGIEDNKLDVVENVKQALDQWDFSQFCSDDNTNKKFSLEVVTFPTKYPSGGEKQLIEILTGKQVPSGGLPADLGIVCQNLGTAVAIRDAVVDDIPLISRITTFTGDAIKNKGNVEVLLGTPIKFMLDSRDYNQEVNNRLIMGGPMMGFAVQDLAAPIVKTTNCILAPSEKELPTPPLAQACIRCGMCAQACPASLLPQQLFWFAQGKELDKLVAHNISDCIECGACSYVCPSHIPLVQYYRASKSEIRQREIDMKNAEASKLRFDARQERLERLEQEKIAARKARQAKAAANKAKTAAAKNNSGEDDKAAAIAAAVERTKARKAQLNENQTAVDANDPIAKALAQRQAKANAKPLDEAGKLREAVEKAQQRLDKAKERLSNAEASNDENIAAFKTAVEKCDSKLKAAQEAAKDLPPLEPVKKEQEKTSTADDPIARALAKRQAQANAAPLDKRAKAEQAVEKAVQRLEKAKQRLSDALENNDDNVTAFETAVQKCEEKLQTAKQALDQLKPE